MFTLGSFSAFFWTLAAIILLMIVFEEKLLKLEEKYDKKKAMKKRAKTRAKANPQSKNESSDAQLRRISPAARNTSSRAPRNYAA